MIINKNSWHYRIVTKGENAFYDVPTSLCPYVRKLTGKILGWLVLGFMLLAICTMIGTGILQAFGIVAGAIFWVGSAVAGVLVVSAALGIAVGIAFGVYYLHTKWKERKERKKYKTMKERVDAGLPPEPPKSLMREWLDAKHDKICPTLEFNDDKS